MWSWCCHEGCHYVVVVAPTSAVANVWNTSSQASNQHNMGGTHSHCDETDKKQLWGTNCAKRAEKQQKNDKLVRDLQRARLQNIVESVLFFLVLVTFGHSYIFPHNPSERYHCLHKQYPPTTNCSLNCWKQAFVGRLSGSWVSNLWCTSFGYNWAVTRWLTPPG